MKTLKKCCDELPTSLVYMDTSVVPHKVLGHVLVEKMVDVEKYDEESRVEFDLGTFDNYIFLK